MKKIIASTVLCMGLSQAADPETTGSQDLTVREVADHVWDKTQTQVITPTVEYVTGGRFEKDADRALNQTIAVEQKVETYVKKQAPKDKKRLEKNVKREKHKLLKKAGLKKGKK